MAKLLVPQVIVATDAGLSPTLPYEDAEDGGNEFVNSGRMFIHAKNSFAGERTVKVNSQVLCSQNVDHDITCVITDVEDEVLLGPFPKDRFNDPAGKVQITYVPTEGTNIKIAIFELP